MYGQYIIINKSCEIFSYLKVKYKVEIITFTQNIFLNNLIREILYLL